MAIAALVVLAAIGVPGSASAASDADGDGLPNTFERQKSHTNPHRKDTDRDGVRDTYEDPDGDGLWNRYEFLAGTNPRKKDTDGDGTRDGGEDPDRDGLTNAREQAAKTYPRKADTDGDGTRDDREDPDRDGLWNLIEFRAGTAPRDADSDDDGFRDGVEGTRDDGLSNGVEQRVGTNPGLRDTDGDGKADGREDPDGDGLMTLAEIVRDLDPKDADSDDDGTLDGDESVAVVDAPVIQGAPDCTVFPADNVWNVRVDALDVATNSATMISTIGANRSFHMDFGSYAGYGIPYQVVDGTGTMRTVVFDYDDESDPGPYPIPAFPLIEDGSDAHMLLVDRDGCTLYELFAARQSASGTWHAGSGAIWDLSKNDLRPAGWTSADAAGLPILPGPRSLGRGGGRRDHARAPVHRAGDARHLHLPRPPRGRVARRVAAADGPAGQAQGHRQPEWALARREGHRRRPPALRDDPRRQRVALVRVGRERPALRRRRAPRARPIRGLGPGGGRHHRPRQRALAASSTREPGCGRSRWTSSSRDCRRRRRRSDSLAPHGIDQARAAPTSRRAGAGRLA